MSEQVSVVEHAPDHAATGHAEAAVLLDVPFDEEEIQEFDAADGDAGRAIGKMLASFFLYTVIVMSLVGWWTVTRK